MEKDYIKRLAIIKEAECWNGYGKEEGKTVFNLMMVCISGSDKGKEWDKRYVFNGSPPEYLRRDLLLMGYLVETVKRLEHISNQLIGAIVRVSLKKSSDTLHVYIDDYFGRDNPNKYIDNG